MEDNRQKVAKFLRQARRLLHYKQNKMAAIFQIAPETLNRYEKAKEMPSADRFLMILQILVENQIDINSLLAENASRKRNLTNN